MTPREAHDLAEGAHDALVEVTRGLRELMSLPGVPSGVVCSPLFEGLVRGVAEARDKVGRIEWETRGHAPLWDDGDGEARAEAVREARYS